MRLVYSFNCYQHTEALLKYKCEMAGIHFIETEEAYTSKCDALAREPIGKHDSYLGLRIRRGLFQSGVGKLVNANVNGALNIMRKVFRDSDACMARIVAGCSCPRSYLCRFLNSF